jgi:AraC family transcriptional regulator of adaptative response/methylated-DNA-[protein]-cysteine methyltransferase
MTANRDYRRIESAIHWIRAHAAERPSVAALAAAVSLSPFHFSRLFRRWAGISPHQYLRTLTLAEAKRSLRETPDLLSASMDAGLSGSGRLHDLFVQMEAMTPAEYRQAGQGLTIRFGEADSPFGRAGLAATDRGVCAVEFLDGGKIDLESSLANRWPGAHLERDDEAATTLSTSIFARGARTVPVHVRGTNFQIQVWRALLRIPAGETISYGGLARAAGRPGSGRAVGGAVGVNPVAFLIPCHRVLRGDGQIGGYRWRPERKEAILAWENASLAS